MIVNAEAFLQMYKDVWAGESVKPRGQLCKEVTDYKLSLNMSDSPWTSFKARNLNIKYAKQEFLWYSRADKYDNSIEEYASMWQKIRQDDGSYFSNYGQYIFPKQFWFVVNELLIDPDSRRASIVLLKSEHLFRANKDVVCTYAINFRIRNGKLDMTVMMRSNDCIFGTTNDVFCFSMLYRMVHSMLETEVGTYTHFVNSLHVYEKHFPMIQAIIEGGMSNYMHVDSFWPTPNEATMAVFGRLMPNDGKWAKWLYE
jgi:thymidylate synthase